MNKYKFKIKNATEKKAVYVVVAGEDRIDAIARLRNIYGEHDEEEFIGYETD